MARLGFVGTRFAGTDGVSLEAAKWARVLWDHRHVSYWFAGQLDTDPNVSMLVPHAYFGHSDIDWINQRIFGRNKRDPDITRLIYAISDHLKRSLYDFTRKFEMRRCCARRDFKVTTHDGLVGLPFYAKCVTAAFMGVLPPAWGKPHDVGG